MHEALKVRVRPIERTDYEAWHSLWLGYNAFYGRVGQTALAADITAATWERFFAPREPVRAFVAEYMDRIVGLVHYLFHRSTTRRRDVCYLEDLFTKEELRGRGVGRQLIVAVYAAARDAGCSQVYWQTQTFNAKGRALYDKLGEYREFIVYSHEL
jgi:GNAT superfamily N-acetyltransferase